ncbi:MAG: phosphoribosylaminoimidazolesuccinocarboxamide synthase [Deltaproteobacteria bacterium]|nr:phosphoribosylaminoimidazolesuccinocarboxamide synthase [Deltaproteobacteria bacterium]
MSAGQVLNEGKSKKMITTDDPEVLIQYFKDDATAFNGVKKGIIGSKGKVNCAISARIFQWLETEGVKTHYRGLQSEIEMLVDRVEIIPLEVVFRNVAAGSLAKRFGIEEGTELDSPLQEFFLKDDDLGDPLLTRNHVLAFGWADDETMDHLIAEGRKVHDLLTEFWKGLGIKLVDHKLEFGRRADGTIVLADEITPDGCRLWEIGTDRKMDKDRFRRSLGKVEETYAEVADLVAKALPLDAQV